MTDRPEIPSGTDLDLINIVVNTQALCLQYAFEHVAREEGLEAASALKVDMLAALKDGSIDMALLEDAAIFDFVVSIVEKAVSE